MDIARWNFDPKRWPGPDRVRWGIDRDAIEPSPDGRYAAVLYSCCEIQLNCSVGLLTLLNGPPERPSVLLQPPGYTCIDCSPAPSIQWLAGSRYCVVTAYHVSQMRNVVELLAFTFFDLTRGMFAQHDTTPQLAGSQFFEVGNEWIIPAIGAPDVDVPRLSLTADRLVWRRWEQLYK